MAVSCVPRRRSRKFAPVGMTEAEILSVCPDLERDDLAEALRYAAGARARTRVALGWCVRFRSQRLVASHRAGAATERPRRPCICATVVSARSTTGGTGRWLPWDIMRHRCLMNEPEIRPFCRTRRKAALSQRLTMAPGGTFLSPGETREFAGQPEIGSEIAGACARQ